MLLEIRPGEGGDDAVNFANEIFKALCNYVQRYGSNTRTISKDRTLIAQLDIPYKKLHNYTGVHRIQRQPKNDSKGRRHTSTCTVAVLDDIKIDEIQIDEKDLRVDTYRGSGNGGQHRNKTDSAVRITHLPTGTVVASENERSQHLNKQTALRALTRLLETEQQKQTATKTNSYRNFQISSGERSVKEFTWNTQRNEVIDHTTGKRWNLRKAMKGRFDC